MVDVWIRLRQADRYDEQIRTIQIAKARGSASSRQIMEFSIGDDGIDIEIPYALAGKTAPETLKQRRKRRNTLQQERRKRRIESLRRTLELAKAVRDGEERHERLDLEQTIADLEDRIAALTIESETERLNSVLAPRREDI